ncbi:vacuolar protein sorting-associated protein 33A, partial [Tremellales sp. Uapishka_1]
MSTSSTPSGPSRLGKMNHASPPAPSTSGDSDSTAAQPVEKGLDVGLLKELAKSALVESLNEIQGTKTLIIDPALAGPVGLITEVALLKHQAVDKIFWLEDGPLNATTRNVVWLCRPRRSFMRIIADQVRSHQTNPLSSAPLNYTLLCVPRATELCRHVLETEGVAGDITISEFKLEFIPMEEDILSLEMDHVARDIFLDGDDTSIYYSSLALMTFQRAFGLFPRILGKGDGAKKLANLLQKHQQSGQTHFSDIEPSEQVDALIILDRSVDWVTPMCTQLTYEGMLDEFVGIKNGGFFPFCLGSSTEISGATGHIELDPSLLNPQAPQAPASASALPSTPITKKRKHPLSASTDKLFAEIRDLNFAVVGSRLSKLARRLEGDYGGVSNLKSVPQLKEFVGKLGGLQNEQQSLRLRAFTVTFGCRRTVPDGYPVADTGLTEQLMPITRTDEFNKTLEAQQNLVAGYDALAQLSIIEDLMNQQAPMTTVLRSAILMSLTCGGIKPKPLEAFKRDFLQTLNLLAKSPTTPPSSFPALRKSLRLVVDDINELNPNDISYVYSGYAPISIRLVQCLTQKNSVLSTNVHDEDSKRPGAAALLPRAHPISGWKGFEDVLQGIQGETVDVKQRSNTQVQKPETVTTVVFFLGGCTFTEIAALRWMSKQTKGRRFLIATTGIINGSSLVESFGDKAPVPLASS